MKTLFPLALAIAAACGAELHPTEVEPEAEEAAAGGDPAALAACAGFNADYRFPALGFLWDGYPSRVTTELSSGVGSITVNPVSSGGQRDFLLTHIGPGGGLVWAKRYGWATVQEEGLSIVESYDGAHVVIAGQTGQSGLIAKIRLADGAVVWARMTGSPLVGTVEKLNNIMRRSDVLGTDYIASGTEVDGGVFRQYLIRVRDFDGSQVWAKRYLGPAGVQDFAVGMQPDPATGRIWIAPQHRQAGFDSFSLQDVNPFTGVNVGPLHVFQPSVVPERAIFGDFAVVPNGFIATYRRMTSLGKPRIGVLRIGPGMVPMFEKTYREAADISGTGYAVFPVPGDFFDVSTAVTTTAGIVAGYLRIDAIGTPVWHRIYSDFAPSGVSPMARTSTGYLLRSMNLDTLQLTSVSPAGGDCCERDLPLAEERHDIRHLTTPYTNQNWGEALSIQLAPIDEVPTIDTCS